MAGRVDDAIDEYCKIIEENQNLSKSMYDEIRYYQKKENYSIATEILKKALSSVLNK